MLSLTKVFRLLFVSVGFAALGSAATTRVITLDTSPLIGHPAGPFSLAFQLTDGDGTGDANNTVTVSGFQFGSGGASGSPVLSGGASGSLGSVVTLTDSEFVNFLVQPFTPGSQLTFAVTVTGNLETGLIPDRFAISILDSTGAEIPTLGGENFDAFVAVVVDSPDPTFEIFASDTIRTPVAGGDAITMSTPIVITDVTPPNLTVTLSPNILSPPNHKLIQVTATIQANDDYDPSPRVELLSITSSEPDNGLDDGDTANDIQGAVLGSDDRAFLLRAERSGTGNGRIYTVTYRATDVSGNATSVNKQVIVRLR